MNDEMLDKALRAPLSTADPSLGYYALSRAAWKLIKNTFSK
ncbi:hypothetical protein [Bifidobacterium samirii]|uniref:Uncharacterized protein n=1 Tax=Bifidobacterium samirii TaxID=2306974 RepID=A0A430FUL9_9BIFI|nr:hypothetical protein [Bifidobacterium samirii]RSX57001.1 hypothetical protein D2E24_0946 [Bifidobacterium samirii]